MIHCCTPVWRRYTTCPNDCGHSFKCINLAFLAPIAETDMQTGLFGAHKHKPIGTMPIVKNGPEE